MLLTAPHDGELTQIGAYTLPEHPDKFRDGATYAIAREAYEYLDNELSLVPTLIADLVRRNHRTPQTMEYFRNRVFGEIHKQTQAFADQPIRHLDIHGFRQRLPHQDYDLILGTAHRKTVGTHDTDFRIADFMRDRGYTVYLPTTEPHENESLTAEPAATLAQKVRTLGIAAVSTVQVEINRTFRTRDATERGCKLSRDLGDLCISLSSS